MPTRLFDPHPSRSTIDLAGGWELYLPPEADLRPGPPPGSDTRNRIDPLSWAEGTRHELLVPGVWESLIGLENYRGQAVLRTQFTTVEPCVRLVFEGVSHTCRVFVDGVEVGGHHNAFTGFAIDLMPLESGEHELLVWLTNEHSDLSALHAPNDYYDYGGIIRPVCVQELNAPLYLHHAHISPKRGKNGFAADLVLHLRNLASEPVPAALGFALAGQNIDVPRREYEPGPTRISLELDFPHAEAWSPQNPMLYEFYATLEFDDGRGDDLKDRVGFRTVRIDGTRLLLNEQPVFLRGFNRHEDHPDHGSALPLEQIRRDVELMRDLGANAVRTSHYPNDRRLLDLCDGLGLMVWEENHARGLSIEQMNHPAFDAQCAACIDEMIEQHHNHPCIVVWGILNECESGTEEGRAKYAQQFQQIRELDASRPTTFASNRYDQDLCQDLPDIAGWNIYPNWYGQRPMPDGVLEHLQRLEQTVASQKPIIFSEFGGGAIPGFRDPRRMAKWSEERQAVILDELLGVILSHERLCGAFIWQFCDVRVDEAFAINRPRTMNNKGVVDEYRRPKLSYAVVQHHFRQAAEAGR